MYQVSARVRAGVRLVQQMERAEALAQRVDAQALILYSLEAELEAQVVDVAMNAMPTAMRFICH